MPPDSPAPVARAACAWHSCSAEFSTFHQLAAHLLSAHIDCDRPPESANSCEWYLCDAGGRPMPSRADLIFHLKTHTGNRSYLCPVDGCSKIYKRSDFLAKHINTHSTLPPSSSTAAAPARLRANHVNDNISDASSHEDAPLALVSTAAAPLSPTRKRRRYRPRQQHASPKSDDDNDDANDDGSSDDSISRIAASDMPEPERQAALLEAQLTYIRDQVSARKVRLLRNKTKMRRLRLENDILIDALART
ncbi:hypothetical protein GGI23_001699 [Coemansia sp. RSA 2559]|nr:hypothetical protein GGI23_001699 [Coemansia sp. RSA 2559]KAJ2853777.1 hypothetical protein GGI22_004735 [Coemansia erecta]